MDGPGDASGTVLSFRNGFANAGRWGPTATDSGRTQDRHLLAFVQLRAALSWSNVVPPAGFEPATHGLGRVVTSLTRPATSDYSSRRAAQKLSRGMVLVHFAPQSAPHKMIDSKA